MILALESVFDQCSVACVDLEGRVIAEQTLTGNRLQTQQILPMIQALMTDNLVTWSQLSAIAFNRGPGAFSGIRINTAVTQALAVAHDLPCVGVSSLQAIAQSAFEQFGVTHGYSALDARMQQVYFGEYQLDTASQIMAPVIEENLNHNQRADQKNNSELFNVDDEKLLDYQSPTPLKLPIFGNGAPFLTLQPEQAIFEQISPDAIIIAKLGAAKFAATGGVNAELALPNYLRNQAWKTLKEQVKA